ncbi:MAG: carboxypeptidase-like regulatory domain-containing protein, partial [bacterium]|nr:carboxypeptidase-like regulatory domain-containing protein [bacterium]
MFTKAKILAVFLLLTLLCASTSLGETFSTVEGFIKDEKLTPIPYANVFFIGSIEGVITDTTGYFQLNTTQYGQKTLRVSHISYSPQDISVDITPGKKHELTIILKESVIEFPPVVVLSTGSFSIAEEEGHTLTIMDIVTTAGSAADVLETIQTFPGVNRINEGSGMYVRGGDVS